MIEAQSSPRFDNLLLVVVTRNKMVKVLPLNIPLSRKRSERILNNAFRWGKKRITIFENSRMVNLEETESKS